MTQRDPDEPQAELTQGLADDGMAPLVTNTGADDDDTAGDDADAPTG
jgi:hypothetical protein